MKTKVVCLDVETTGLDKGADRVIEVCIRDYHDENRPVFLRRFKSPVPIAPDAQACHGISDEDLIDCPSFAHCADDVKSELERADVIVGYNVDFDIEMLQREFQLSVTEVKWPTLVVDAYRLWNIHRPRKRNLQEAYIEFVHPSGFEGAHGAVADTLATVKVLKNQLISFNLETTPWDQLDAERARWFALSDHFVYEDATILCNFGKHKGQKVLDIDFGYLKYLQEKDFPRHVKALAEYTTRIKRLKEHDSSKHAKIYLWAKAYR